MRRLRPGVLGTVTTMAERGEMQNGRARERLGAVELPPNAPPGTVRVVTGTTAR
jgi:hypothetical protein